MSAMWLMQWLPWAVALVALALCLSGLAFWAWSLRRSTRVRALPTEWALAARPVFSTDERRIYRLLREALPHHIVLSKLPLVRFCQPTDPNDVRYWYDLLGNNNVAFAVCSNNGRVLAAIDLDTDRGNSRRVLQIKYRCSAPAASATSGSRSTTCLRWPNCSCSCRTAAPRRAAHNPRRCRHSR